MLGFLLRFRKRAPRLKPRLRTFIACRKTAKRKLLMESSIFAAEVRSEDDYGPVSVPRAVATGSPEVKIRSDDCSPSDERAIAAKRADYFAAGTLVIWDVDLLSPDVIKSYTPEDPGTPKIFRRGDIADAEPAVPGWRIPVDELFS